MTKKSYKIIYFFIFILFFLSCKREEETSGVVVGENVRLRKAPSLKGEIITKCNTGLKVVVMEKTEKRDKLQGREEYGYHWYKIEIPSGETGWLYGKFLYIISKTKFVKNKKIFKKYFTFNGEKYHFGIAVEPSYPAVDREGLTGSEIHALPFFYIKGKERVIPFMVDKSCKEDIIFREEKKPYIFKLIDGEGIGEEIVSIKETQYKGEDIIELEIEYTTQEEEGKYILFIKPGIKYGRVVKFKLL